MPGWEHEEALVEKLRAGDARAFREVVEAYHASLVRVAETFVPSHAVAEEVAQDTWQAVITGIDRFEGRSSLKTWIFQILTNQARTRGARERRTVPASSLASELDEGPSVPLERFAGPEGRGAWAQPPARWSDQPATVVEIDATFAALAETVKVLPENQRRVLLLRDVEGWSSQEVCDLLDLTEVNQRVLLHRARSTVRAMLETRLGVTS